MKNADSHLVLSIGEAMIEMAAVEPCTYRQGYAGDTLNTIWHMAQLLHGMAQAGCVTRIGTDKFSDRFAEEMSADGLEVSGVSRDPKRRMGLYLIDLEGVERSFHYWREESAARHLADDQVELSARFAGAKLIHLSGITLAILGAEARASMFSALAEARLGGAKVSFDPNIRRQLWSSEDEIRSTVSRMVEMTDIALPSFEDDEALWRDTTPIDTIARYRAQGVGEVVVKNGPDAVHYAHRDGSERIKTPFVDDVRDTTGAGDAFNAAYLAARLMGWECGAAIALGQKLSAKVIATFGARVRPRFIIAPLREAR